MAVVLDGVLVAPKSGLGKAAAEGGGGVVRIEANRLATIGDRFLVPLQLFLVKARA